MTDINRSAVDSFFVGSGEVDAEAKPIVAAGYAPDAVYKGIRIRANSANTGLIYVGNVGVSPTNGFELDAAEAVDIAVTDIHQVYVVAVSANNATQTVTLANLNASGKWVLTYKGQTTTALAQNAAAATVQTALRALSTIGSGNVDVTGNAGGPYTVEFVGDLAGLDADLLVGDVVNEVQNIAIADELAGDTIVYTLGAESTDPLAAEASAAAVQAALEAFTGVGAGNVEVTAAAGGYNVEFIGDLADTDVGAITGVGGKNEIQTITVSGGVAGATMVLTWGGNPTASLAYNVAAADLEDALEALDGIEPGDVSVTGTGPYAVEFKGLLAGTDVGAITGVGGANETQTVTVSGGVAGATMVLTVGAAGDTAALAYNVSGANLQTALESIAAIGAGNVAVVGDGPYAITFQGALAKTDIATITGVGGVNETQTITLNGVTSGTFTLTYGAQTTVAIAYDAAAATVEAELAALSSVGSGNVAVTGTTPEWAVEFTGTLAKTDVSAITGDNTNLVGDPATITVVETQKGANLTIGVVENQKGTNLTIGVEETAKGNTLTVTVTESIKGDPDGTVTVASTAQASDGCKFSWISE